MLSKGKPAGKIFIVSGSSGSGKTTLLSLVCGKKEFRGNLIKITTVTTRSPRASERRGKDYIFVTKDEFLRLKNQGRFVESQEIYGDYYATPKKGLLEVLRAGKDALLCIDVRGGLSLRRVFPKNSVRIFISVPRIQSLKERLRSRSSESAASLKKRLRIARQELKSARRYDYILMNDVLPEAVKKLSAIVMAERLRVAV